MKKLGFLRYVFTAPTDFISLLIVLAIRAMWGKRLVLEAGCVIVELDPKSWPMRTWYRGWGGTTFCHAIMLAPLGESRVRVLEHELVHVRQMEGYALLGLVLAVPLAFAWHPLAALVAWSVTPLLAYECAGIVAVLRGGSFYTDNANEQAAYDAEGRHR